jgi:hypothetical protein
LNFMGFRDIIAISQNKRDDSSRSSGVRASGRCSLSRRSENFALAAFYFHHNNYYRS